MKYCVIIKITRSTIEFRYQIDNDPVELLALKDSEQVIPLAFCINGEDLLMGNYALERAMCGDPYAYTNYFELIKDPIKVFRYANEDRPIKQILHLGVERYLSFFLREKLLISDSSISSNRADFPLRICFSQDVNGNERRFVVEQFIVAGYRNVAEVTLENTLFHLATNSNRDKLLLTGLNGNLILSYFNTKSQKFEQTKILPELGSDPRYKKCVEFIIDYIKSGNPFFNIDIESNMVVLMAEAQKILQSDQTLMQGCVYFNDGSSYDYEMSCLELKQQLSQCNSNQIFLSEVEYFIKTQGIEPNSLDVVMDGSVNTDYFIDKLHERFPNVFGISDALYRQMWAQVFNTIDLTPPRIESTKSQPSGTIVGPQLPPIPGNNSRVAPPMPVQPKQPPVPSVPRVPQPPQRSSTSSTPPPPPSPSGGQNNYASKSAKNAIPGPPPPPASKSTQGLPPAPPPPKNKSTKQNQGKSNSNSSDEEEDSFKDIATELKNEMGKVGAKAAKALSFGLGRMKDKLDELSK